MRDSHKTVSTDNYFWRRSEADSNWGPPAYQPNALHLPVGQTGSHRLSQSVTGIFIYFYLRHEHVDSQSVTSRNWHKAWPESHNSLQRIGSICFEQLFSVGGGGGGGVKRRPRSRYRLFTDTVSVLNVFCASQSVDPNRRRDAGDCTDSHSQCLPGVPHSIGVVKVLLYVHRNRRLIRDGSPWRPPRLSHSSWALTVGVEPTDQLVSAGFSQVT